MHPAIVLDCTDPERLAEFWAQALGYHAEPPAEPYLVLLPPEGAGGPELVLQRVPEPKAGKTPWVVLADPEGNDPEGPSKRSLSSLVSGV